MKAAEAFGNSEQLITRREAIDVIKKHRRLHDNDLLELLEYELEHLSSAEIACKDCEHYIPHDKRCNYWNHGVEPSEWCCHAGRRNNG